MIKVDSLCNSAEKNNGPGHVLRREGLRVFSTKRKITSYNRFIHELEKNLTMLQYKPMYFEYIHTVYILLCMCFKVHCIINKISLYLFKWKYGRTIQ